MMSGFLYWKLLRRERRKELRLEELLLVEEAKKKHILLSEYEVREILASMEQQGWVKIRRGRGGTRITQKAKTFYKKKMGENDEKTIHIVQKNVQ